MHSLCCYLLSPFRESFRFFHTEFKFLLVVGADGLCVNAERCPQSALRKLPERDYRVFTIGLCDKVTVDFLGKCDKVTVDGATK